MALTALWNSFHEVKWKNKNDIITHMEISPFVLLQHFFLDFLFPYWTCPARKSTQYKALSWKGASVWYSRERPAATPWPLGMHPPTGAIKVPSHMLLLSWQAPVCPWWQCSGFLALRVVSSPLAFPELPPLHFWYHMLLIVHGWFPSLLSWGSRRNLLFICCWCCHCHPAWVCSYTYTLLYPKQTTNKDLLHSTGNSAQCYMGKESEKV